MLGKHLIKSWSNTQSIGTLSSGESEYYGLVRGSSVALGIKSLLEDFGIFMKVVVNSDSSAALGMVKDAAWEKRAGCKTESAVVNLWCARSREPVIQPML